MKQKKCALLAIQSEYSGIFANSPAAAGSNKQRLIPEIFLPHTSQKGINVNVCTPQVRHPRIVLSGIQFKICYYAVYLQAVTAQVFKLTKYLFPP